MVKFWITAGSSAAVDQGPDEPYETFVERIATADGEAGRLARLVKKADTRDNLGRMTPELRSRDSDRESRYKNALARLEEVGEDAA